MVDRLVICHAHFEVLAEQRVARGVASSERGRRERLRGFEPAVNVVVVGRAARCINVLEPRVAGFLGLGVEALVGSHPTRLYRGRRNIRETALLADIFAWWGCRH